MSFDPAAHGTGIVHIGPGAFHRAHQAVYTQQAMEAAGGDWRITGVSLRSTTIADALTAQDGRYTLVVRAAEGPEFCVIKALSGAVSAAQGLEPVFDVLAAPSTKIVSLTVTEKAYQITPSSEETNVIRVLVEALSRRKTAGLNGVTLLSCDNLADNGRVLREAVLGHAGAIDPGLVAWIQTNVSFPSTMVDRITPATTPALVQLVKQDTGWGDQIPIETEPFSQWIIEDNFVQGRPAWEAAGALLVSDVKPYEHMKLRMLNGSHSLIAYAGHLTGQTYVRDVMAHGALAKRVAQHMKAAAATLDPISGIEFEAYGEALLARFRNPHIAHETYQIAMDGSQKMPPRIFAPALEAAQQGQDIAPYALATALWLRYLEGRTDTDTTYALRDPREAELSALPLPAAERVNALFALPNLVPAPLAANSNFHRLIVTNLKAFATHGVEATLSQTQHV